MKIDHQIDMKRYALLLAAKDSDYVMKMYGGYFNVFVNAFGDDDEGENGSPYDAYGNEFWILKLCFLLQTLDAMEKKVLGICFGHQVLCRALGGKIGKASSGWDIGLRKVRLAKDLTSSFSFLSNCMDDIPPCLSIIECHQDEVWEVPDGAEVIAFSEKTSVEMFGIGEHILGIQGHPEYTKDIVLNLIDRLLNTNFIEGGFAEDAKWRLEVAEPDRKSWVKICKSFLKGKEDIRFTRFTNT
ncbi:Glutamine amidotransferase [Macleaya cordata]|uniref:Glutamine amidotransferase n=1 Tax=Macleaya cordata TaxID=56857 RepID=A0A200QEN5_MACCD|nr:Glutamine amidotransferase [Macleaya cordata]